MNLNFKQILLDNHLYRTYISFLQYIVISEYCLKTTNSIDVGCHVGQYTFAMSKKSNKVFAFDPLPDLLKSIKNKPNLRNFLNYLIWPKQELMSNIVYYQNALGDVNELKDFYVYDKRSRSRLYQMENTDFTIIDKFEVEVKKIDGFGFNNISFIKINAEGYDYKVIEGAANLISNQRPFIMTEFTTSEKSFDQHDLTLIKNLNYRHYSVIPEFNNLEFVLFYPAEKNISNLENKIKDYNLFWTTHIPNVIKKEKRLNQFKLDLVNYFSNF